MNQPLTIEGHHITVGASIGIAAGTANPETLLRLADAAMYRAKHGHANETDHGTALRTPTTPMNGTVAGRRSRA